MSYAIVIAAGLALAMALLWFLQRSMIYFPFGAVPDPAAVGLRGIETVAMAPEDGETLQGWWVPRSPTGRSPHHRAAVIVFNGNAGNRGYRADLALALGERGFAVLLFDYRGYGGSTGRPSEQGLAADARRIIYFGESLGAGVAVGLAVESPPAALVLRSPFTSLGDVGQLHYPFLPVKRLLRDRYPSLDRVAGLNCPIAVVAGDRDSIIPIAQSRVIYDAAPGTKTWTVVTGADHNDPSLAHGPRVIDAIEHIARRP